MGNFFDLAARAIEIQGLLLPFSFPLAIVGIAAILFGICRENPGLSENRVRLVTACLAQGVPSGLVLLYGAMEYHIVPGQGVSRELAAGFIDGPLLVQIPLVGTWAWWSRRAWPVSLGTSLCWGAYSLGAGCMAGMAATGMWL